MTSSAVTLRRWDDADTEIAQTLVDPELSRWFGARPTPGAEPAPSWLHGYPPEQSVAFAVLDAGSRALAGQVAVRLLGDDVGELSWAVLEPFRRRGLARAAVDQVLTWCFTDGGLARVQAFIEPANEASRRTARACGLRYEGVLRAHETVGGSRRDMACHAILATDPRDEAGRRWAAMRAELPRRVLSAGVVVRDEVDRVLLLQTSYKPDWTIPGGVVEAGEGLQAAARREVREELGVDLPIGPLLLVDSWPADGDAPEVTHAVFDGGRLPAGAVDAFTFPDGEVVAAHWSDPADVLRLAGPRLGRRLITVLNAWTAGTLPDCPLQLRRGTPETPD